MFDSRGPLHAHLICEIWETGLYLVDFLPYSYWPSQHGPIFRYTVDVVDWSRWRAGWRCIFVVT